jgi:DNA ligase (NAD+)
MEMIEAIRKEKELLEEIVKLDKAYYDDDAPLLSDFEYDRKVQELQSLEKKTGIVFDESPTKKVEGSIKQELTPVVHSKPMLSANKTKDRDEFASFRKSQDVVLSWKLDGLTLVLRYHLGKLDKAITRGKEGLIGEDVTSSVRLFRNVPATIPDMGDIEVRGEGFVPLLDYEELVDEKDTSSPRNLASGAVRALRPDSSKLTHMEFQAFELINGPKFKTKMAQLSYLEDMGFAVVSHRLCQKEESKEAFLSLLDSFVPDSYSNPVDGVMMEYNDLAYGESLGKTSHHENCRLAYKWQDENYVTTFRGVELTVSRNGLIGLVCLFDPIIIEGSLVKRANLHNLDIFRQLKLGIGDQIKVFKANKIIPQVEKNLTNSNTYRIPSVCPSCGQPLSEVTSSGGVHNFYCSNPLCGCRNAALYYQFAGPSGLGIDGLSENVLFSFLQKGYIHSFIDIFHLDKYANEIVNMPGFGYQSWKSLQKSIESKKSQPMENFLQALGIPGVGPGVANSLALYYRGSMDKFVADAKSGFPFSHIAEIDGVTEREITAYFSDQKNVSVVDGLLKEITITTHKFASELEEIGKPQNSAVFLMKRIAVSGILRNYSRKTIQSAIVNIGGIYCDDVSSRTDYLLCGKSPGSKLAKAKQYGTAIISEEEFENKRREK